MSEFEVSLQEVPVLVLFRVELRKVQYLGDLIVSGQITSEVANRLKAALVEDMRGVGRDDRLCRERSLRITVNHQ